MKLINKLSNYMKNFIHMFNNVNKSHVLQHKFKNIKNIKNDLNETKLLTLNT